MNRSSFAAAVLSGLMTAGMALGQSAAVTVAGPLSAAPGDMVTVTLTSSYDTAGASGGIFGSPGFYGFGGTVSATGSAAGNVSGSAPVLSGQLTAGAVASVNNGSLLRAAAGRGLAGGIADNPADMTSFTLVIDGAASGEVTLDFSGTVVLVIGSDLESYSTSPGPNQNPLSTTALTITIEDTGCPCDLNGTDSVDVLDLLDFLGLWFPGDAGSDFNNDGSFASDVLDLLEFLSCWFPASTGNC